MHKIAELQMYVENVGEESAEFDFQLLIAMRDGEFEPGKLALAILSCYKELTNSRDVLADWSYPSETEDHNIFQLIHHLSKE